MNRLTTSPLLPLQPLTPEFDALTDRFVEDMKNDISHFYNLPNNSSLVSELHETVQELQKRTDNFKGIKHFIHIGIGGSSLGTEALIRMFHRYEGSAARHLEFHFFDNIDTDAVQTTLRDLNPAETFVYVVTKSGSTAETLSVFMIVYDWLCQSLDEKAARDRLAFCTDPTVGDLRTLANQWRVPTFSVPKTLGGRFSVLSAIGLFPMHLIGFAPERFLSGAQKAQQLFGQNPKQSQFTLLANAIVAHSDKPITVFMPYSQRLKTLGAWFNQLWAESLGKNGLGRTPMACVGATDQHSVLQLLRDGPKDKITGFIEVLRPDIDLIATNTIAPELKSFSTLNNISLHQLMTAEFQATRQVLQNQGRPTFTLTLEKITPESIGHLLFDLELLTAITGYLLGINPFDQPGVEEGKVLAGEYLRDRQL